MRNANFVAEGMAIDYTPSAAVSAGDIVDLGDLIGIAKRPIDANALGALAVEGEFDVLKDGTSGPVFSVGDVVFWDTVNSLAVRVGGSGLLTLGTCTKAAATNEDRVRVELRPHGIPAIMQDKTWEDVDISGGSKTLDAQDSGKVMNVTVGDATNVVTLPAVGAGLFFVVRAGVSGQRVAVSPAAADGIHGPDLTGTDDKDRILAAATGKLGDYLALAGGLAAGFMIQAERGVWTQEA